MRFTAGDWGHSVPRASSRPGGRALAARGGVPVAIAGLRRRGGMGGAGALRHPWLHDKGLTDTLCIWQSVSDDTEMPSELEAFATPPAQWGHDNGNTKLEQEGQGLVQAKAARSEVENSGAPLDQVRQQC